VIFLVTIKSVKGLQVLDSRGNPTVCAQVVLSDGSAGVGISPSGASTGAYEAYELRDGDKEFYGGKGVTIAVENINNVISKRLCEIISPTQTTVDECLIELDGTENKSALGANAILAVSIAFARAMAEYYKMPLYRYLGGVGKKSLPIPMMNILNGGAHASNNVDIQEFMILPKGDTFGESIRIGSEIYHKLGKILADKGLSCGVGDEGGFAPNIEPDREALELICEAIVSSGYDFDKVSLALDMASSEWYHDGKYYLPKRGRYMTSDEIINMVEGLCKDFPIVSVEDPLSEDDWDGWREITKKIGKNIQLVGDDLFVTNTQRLKMGFDKNASNAILIKPNQIGTVSETLEVIDLAMKNGYKTVISHRSGESEDTFISDLAVAVSAKMIKSGAPCRTERTAKYNRLLAIEDVLF
jgi:enolase